LISFEHVTKRYPGSAVPALNALDLEIPDGQTMVLVGPSGCGKTTSLRMINRMVDPTEGHIYLDGQDIQQIDPAKLRRGIGYVIQHAGLFPHRTIEDNIGTVPMLVGWSKQKARKRARELMDLVSLDPQMARRYPHQLSGGQQQRVGVARALAADPPVLLMDEPFSAVDPIVRASLQDELLHIQEHLHKTVVFVTHDVEEAIKIGDRVAVFRPGGTLAQVDPPARLLAEPADDYVADFLGFDRGIRRLSFFPASALQLDSAPVVTGQITVGEALTRAKESGQSWLLVTDPQRHPLGWVAVATLAELPVSLGLARAPAEGGGHTFNVTTDSLRAALDATILSPSGQAAGVDGGGRVVGVTSYDQLLATIQALTTGDGDGGGAGSGSG
jgi:osmoprotectant transport system ATP-binding protein